jgi:hypothetical protein
MRYADIADAGANRFRLPPSHPVLAKIIIDPVDWSRLEQLCSDNRATRILGCDDQENGAVTVSIACASLEIRRRLEAGCWR